MIGIAVHDEDHHRDTKSENIFTPGKDIVWPLPSLGFLDMLLPLFLLTLVGLTIAIPTSPTAWTTFPGVSEKLGKQFSYQEAPHTYSPKRYRPILLSKRQSIVSPHSLVYTAPFRFNPVKQILVNISVGSPPQEMEVRVDTASPFTWFPSHPDASHFKSEESTSWSANNETFFLRYVDHSSCSIQTGEDIISVGGTSVRIYLGVGSTEGCNGHTHGMLGMDKNSEFLKAMRDASQTSLFSFSFKNDLTGEGENLFTMGGLSPGFKEEDIIWTPGPDKKQGPRSHLFQIDMPYIAYDRERFNFHRGHKVGIDTASSITILPGDIVDRLWRVVKPKPSLSTLSEGETPPIPFPVYNLTGYMADQHPAMTFRLGQEEWICDIVDTTFGSESEGNEVYLGSVFPDSSFDPNGEIGEISVLGATFWSHLKGLVFDHTPGEERVGLVPRMRLTNKSGLLNPMFVSAGNRSIGQGVMSLTGLICGLISFLIPSLLM